MQRGECREHKAGGEIEGATNLGKWEAVERKSSTHRTMRRGGDKIGVFFSGGIFWVFLKVFFKLSKELSKGKNDLRENEGEVRDEEKRKKS